VNILEKIRLDREYSLRKLGELAGISPNTVFRIENGQPASKLTLSKLAKALGLELETLLPLAETRENSTKKTLAVALVSC